MIFGRSINSTALIHHTTRSTIDLSLVLDLNVYASPDSPIRLQTIAQTFAGSASGTVSSCRDGGQPCLDRTHDHAAASSAHKNDITSITIPLPDYLPSVHHGTFHALVSALVWDLELPEPRARRRESDSGSRTTTRSSDRDEPGAGRAAVEESAATTTTMPRDVPFDLLRAKGFLRTRTQTRRTSTGPDDDDDAKCYVLQAVRDVFDITEVPFVKPPRRRQPRQGGKPQDEDEAEEGSRRDDEEEEEAIESKLVLIGRGFIGREEEIKERFSCALEEGIAADLDQVRRPREQEGEEEE